MTHIKLLEMKTTMSKMKSILCGCLRQLLKWLQLSHLLVLRPCVFLSLECELEVQTCFYWVKSKVMGISRIRVQKTDFQDILFQHSDTSHLLALIKQAAWWTGAHGKVLRGPQSSSPQLTESCHQPYSELGDGCSPQPDR